MVGVCGQSNQKWGTEGPCGSSPWLQGPRYSFAGGASAWSFLREPGSPGVRDRRGEDTQGEGAAVACCLALIPHRPQLALEQRCRELSARGRRLEETLPGLIGSEEQREVLSLLCRVHELEVENTEMQSHALLRDGALRHRREAVRRLEQHRILCDEIIQGQRQIIDGRSRASEPCQGPISGQRVRRRCA